MLWDGIFINAVAAYLPGRRPVETIGPNPGLDDKYAHHDQHAYGGIESITVSDIPAHVMAGIAAKQAVKNSSHRNETLSPIIYADEPLPRQHLTPVCYIQRILKQRESLAFGFEAASDGGVAGIEVVARILSSSPEATAGLVSAANRCLEGVSRWTGGNPLGDGAAAAIISKTGGFARLIASQRTSESDLEVLLENRATQPGVWEILLNEVGVGPYTETITQAVLATISATLVEADISIDQISHFCPPVLVLPSLEGIYLGRSGIPIEKTCWSELRKIGHVGPCDQILAIAHLIETDQLKPGQLLMLIGGGFAWRLTCLLLEAV